MPEGPSIIILKELLQPLKGKKIIEAAGNAKFDIQSLKGQKILDLLSWGKHFLIQLKDYSLRIHFLLFGSYSINEQTKPNPRLMLRVKGATVYFYACSVRILNDDLNEIYDWSADVMNPAWNPRKARKKLQIQPEAFVCDALLDQNIFSGVGNIIKNEVLFRIRVHPLSAIGSLPPKKLSDLIKQAHVYSFDFLTWKKAFELKKHWLAHTKKICPRCGIPFEKVQHLGKTKRRAFFCTNCQILYTPTGDTHSPPKIANTRMR